MEIIIAIGLGLALMMFMSSRGRKKQEEQIRQMHSEIQPGTWVRTASGYYGIVSDVDGDVYILQSPSGDETYWDRRAIMSVSEPPFENTDDTVFDEDVPELTDQASGNSENLDEPVVADSENTDSETVEDSEVEPEKVEDPEQVEDKDSSDAPVEEDPEDLWDDSFAPNDKKSDDKKN